jgi:putative chitinase
MCIVKSVGQGGANDLADVRIFQILFNANVTRFPDPQPAALKPDGRIGPSTLKAIEKFETVVMKLSASDSLIVPGDTTMAALLKGLPAGPSKEKLSIIMPGALPARIDRYYDPLVAGMTKYEINTPLRIAHFLAQIAHESASFLYSEEIASGSAYEGRADLGNTQAGDGVRFKGRGLIQLTGRANHTSYSKDTGIDYVAKPQLLATDPFVAVDVSCWFWNKHKISKMADADDVIAVSKTINGVNRKTGLPNGIDDRISFLVRAKALLGLK